MSVLILKFNLPEDEREARFAMKGEEYFAVLHELDRCLRDVIKYNNNPFAGGMATEEQILLAEQIRAYLREQDINEVWQ